MRNYLKIIFFRQLTIRLPVSLLGCLAFAAATATAAPTSSAAPITLFAAPSGVGITSPAAKPDGTYQFTTATSSQANWAVNQWGNPNLLFPPLRQIQLGSTTTWLSNNLTRGAIQVSRASSGQFFLRLNQDGQSLSCGGTIVPDEFDLFMAPNSAGFVPSFPSATLADTNPGAIPTLGSMTSLRLTGWVRMSRNWVPPVASKCVVNQASVIYSLILSNTTVSPPQALFYQINFTKLLCAPGTDPSRYTWCLNYPTALSYFQAGPVTHSGKITQYQYGLDDPISSFGAPLLQLASTSTLYNLDLRPRLISVIQAGSPAVPSVPQLDTNPAHWKISKMYFGQHIWGNIGIETLWNGMLPVPNG